MGVVEGFRLLLFPPLGSFVMLLLLIQSNRTEQNWMETFVFQTEWTKLQVWYLAKYLLQSVLNRTCWTNSLGGINVPLHLHCTGLFLSSIHHVSWLLFQLKWTLVSVVQLMTCFSVIFELLHTKNWSVPVSDSPGRCLLVTRWTRLPS